MAKAPQKTGLGRGLSELMGDDGVQVDRMTAGRRQSQVRTEKLEPNPYQPRKTFDPESMRELVDSIKEKGVLQPLLVRTVKGSETYQIIAGERRWRAAQKAGLHVLPVVIRDLTDSEALQIGIIENVQRSDLTAVEEAAGYRRLMDEFGHTQEQVAAMVGKSRSHVANLLRLINLPEPVQNMMAEGKLSMGHARTLVGSNNATTLAKMIVSKGLSVREAEKLATNVKGTAKPKQASTEKDADTRALERDLAGALGLNVNILHAGANGGEIRVKYKTLEQLDVLCNKLRS